MPKLSHMHITVTVLDRSVEFYGRKLGLKTTKIMERMASVALGDASLELDLADQDDAEGIKKMAKHVTIAVGVQNVDNFYEEIKSKGVETIDTPTERSWGARNFYLTDPDGYRLEIIQE